MAKVQTVKTYLGGTTLTFVNVHIPPASSWPRNYAPDFDALLEKRGDQMVLGDFNTHHPSWFSRTGDDRTAARGEAIPLYQPPVLPRKKSSGRSMAMPEDTTSPLVMSGITAAFSPNLCDPSSRREISAALKTLSTLPSSCWTGTTSDSSVRIRKTSGGPFWNPPTALPIPNATGPKILGVTLDTHFTFGPHDRDCVERASRALNVMKAQLGRAGASRPKPWWPLVRRLRPSCAPSLTMLLPSGSPKCPPPIWTNWR